MEIYSILLNSFTAARKCIVKVVYSAIVFQILNRELDIFFEFVDFVDDVENAVTFLSVRTISARTRHGWIRPSQ